MEKKDFYLTIKDVKDNTKEYMSGSWVKHAKTTLVYFLFLAVLIAGSVLSFVFSAWYVGLIVTIICSVLFSTFKFGYNSYCLQSMRGEASLSLLFNGFGKKMFKIFFSDVLKLFMVAVGICLLVAPSALFLIKYSVKDFALVDDNNLKPTLMLKQSSKLLSSNYSRFAELFGSFCPLLLLGVISAGIGFIWVLPYYTMAKANFYEDLKTDF